MFDCGEDVCFDSIFVSWGVKVISSCGWNGWVIFLRIIKREIVVVLGNWVFLDVNWLVFYSVVLVFNGFKWSYL